jgi:hypothetical protein
MLGALAVAAGIGQLRPVQAQDAAEVEILATPQLEELVGPIALYPDDLVAIVLPASTYPLQVVEAARFLDARADDPELKPDEDWDDSVVALLNYPEVVRLLNDDLDWTWDLGTAVLNQRADVLDAIQGFRDRAYTAGNLRSDERQVVTADEGTIAIAPADPEVIYVPYYEPRRVVVYQPTPVYHYYPWGYPVYYYPYPAGYAFHTGFFWGVTSAFIIGWHTHNLHVHHYGYYGHPYYGWSYYNPFYVRNNVYVNVNVGYGGDVWQPRHGYGGRPNVRGTEGRVPHPSGGRTPVSRGLPGSAHQGQTQGSTYRSRTQTSANRTAGATRARSDRGVGTVAGTQRPTTTTLAPRQSGSGASATRPDRTGVPRTATTGSQRIGRGTAQALEPNRTRPQSGSGQGQTAQSSRVAPSSSASPSRELASREPDGDVSIHARVPQRTAAGHCPQRQRHRPCTQLRRRHEQRRARIERRRDAQRSACGGVEPGGARSEPHDGGTAQRQWRRLLPRRLGPKRPTAPSHARGPRTL